MQRALVGGVVFYRFVELAGGEANFVHGCFTRLGGVSQPPWASLNTGSLVGDDPAHVQENHERICAALGIPLSGLVSPHQVHGAEVGVAGRPDRGHTIAATDALVSDQPGVYLMLRFADCVPVLLHDPVRHAVGLAHAGWRGTVAGVARATVRCMVDAFGCRPVDIRAGIGPSIGPCCYEVGSEVVEAVREAFPSAPQLVVRRSGGWHFDLWKANRYQLAEEGLTEVEASCQCTSCHNDEWYSYRTEHGRTGRLAVVVGLKE